MIENKALSIGKPRKRAVAYVRVSSGSDAQIHSFEFQSAYWHNELDSNPDVEMVGIYADKGISGRSMYKRPQFLTMMQDAREGKFDVIYTKSISRFGRNTVHLLESVRELRDLGIAVIFQNENINTLSNTSELFMTIAAALAESELEEDSKRQRWSYQDRFQNGWISITSILTNEKYTGNAYLGKTYKPDVLSKKRYRNDGEKAPMYYAENSHPAIISTEVFNMVKLEMERRKEEKNKAVGSSRYTSKYPMSGLLICGTCGSRLRRHVRRVGSGKMVPSWGCANRIVNGRAVCDSHHINEDVLYATYHAAVEAMIEDAGALLEVIQTETEVEMQPRNKAAMDEVEQQIIELQERVLDLHKQKRAMKISDAYYNAQVNDYSQQLGALESRKQALQTADARYATVRMWLADFRQHMQEGDATDDRDGSIMKTLVEAIIVWDDRIEVRFKCGATVEQKYVA